MDTEAIYKALSNPIRRQILQCLKNPEQMIPKGECEQDFSRGVCAGQIEKIADVSQSTMSNHLSVLQQAGLVTVTKHGQWCYFARNEAQIQNFLAHIQHAL
ncbi:winged helix-turn-helix transcriptional regulator [Acinetobacter sp. 187]|uniref:ArsR/SmtB family transcription factor n=1 Tax=Acinetobacter lanii TaxID=2715163 RepID=UPI0014079EBE|nr:metalloregulator ArsR/SmtB family transcription factor [Acinetobacter lanii]NHC03040.1 winged helix-turn-helix transcriptional regulator [Acinetobacter lanii]